MSMVFVFNTITGLLQSYFAYWMSVGYWLLKVDFALQ